jgi:hypothetical protein
MPASAVVRAATPKAMPGGIRTRERVGSGTVRSSTRHHQGQQPCRIRDAGQPHRQPGEASNAFHPGPREETGWSFTQGLGVSPNPWRPKNTPPEDLQFPSGVFLVETRGTDGVARRYRGRKGAAIAPADRMG